MPHDLLTLVRTVVRRLAPVATLLAVASIAGCGDDGLGKRYPVSGTVTYKGEKVAEASIAFYPSGGVSAEKRGATGVVKDGSYTLSTQGGDDGAFSGDYDVSISARVADLSQAKEFQSKVGGGSFRQDDVAKAYKNAKSNIPRKYESPNLLKAKVEAKSNTINFDLTD